MIARIIRASASRPALAIMLAIAGTIFGEMVFEANGQAQHKATLFKVTDGKTGKLEVLK